MRVTAWHVFGGVALYGASSYGAYSYLAAHKLGTENSDASVTPPVGGATTYDTIARKYDDAVGSEEFSMGTPLLRSWLLNHAKGDVLEISAGTGRNLPYYTLGQVRSLTLADLSMPMLEVAEDKFYDELKLGEKHPGTRVSFCIADGHCMAADGKGGACVTHTGRRGGAAHEAGSTQQVHTLPAVRQQQRRRLQLEHEQQVAADAAAAATDGVDAPPPSAFSRLFKQSASQGSSSSSSTAPAAAAADASVATSASASVSTSGGEGGAGSSSWGKPWTWLRALRRDIAPAQPCACSVADAAGCGGGYRERCARSVSDSGLPLSRFPHASFDTVIDAFGMCSHDDPVQVLREAARVCKPDGKILLLQHGRGYYDWLNAQLDESAPKHHVKWGCWWNRDIEALIREAGLEVDKLSRWHFGTTYIVIARPPGGRDARS
ncbi:hypothetical protein FOA52_011293 [Chlamydomonas sp. UWO 241]|nr:hypothetical protein FOA52_011293 [Chlamydomonas sp. UWO 241]